MRLAVITINNAAHQRQHAAWMRAGLERHGWHVEFVGREKIVPTAAAMACSWSIKQRRVWDWQKVTGGPVLVMERAALQPRFEFTSCGFDGLAGRGRYAYRDDSGARWHRYFAHLEQPWKPADAGGYALLCGQVLGDAALWGTNFRRWAQDACNALRAKGMRVVYRPHPHSLKCGDHWYPLGANFSTRPYADDLAGAARVVTFNSTAGVEAVLAGVPAVSCDKGSMAREVTAHAADAPMIQPDRSAWEHRLAWSCFTPAEIESGEAWAALEERAPCFA